MGTDSGSRPLEPATPDLTTRDTTTLDYLTHMARDSARFAEVLRQAPAEEPRRSVLSPGPYGSGSQALSCLVLSGRVLPARVVSTRCLFPWFITYLRPVTGRMLRRRCGIC